MLIQAFSKFGIHFHQPGFKKPKQEILTIHFRKLSKKYCGLSVIFLYLNTKTEKKSKKNLV